MEDLEEYRPALRRYLARRVGRPQEVEDFVQEVFLRVHGALNRGPLGSLRAFLYKTARNLVIDHRRRSANQLERTGLLEARDVAADSADPEEQTALKERTELLLRAILSLPPRCRRAFVLRKFHHLSYRKIAERMEISEKTVEKHLAKALLLCREYLTGAERAESSVVDFEHYCRKRSRRTRARPLSRTGQPT